MKTVQMKNLLVRPTSEILYKARRMQYLLRGPTNFSLYKFMDIRNHPKQDDVVNF